MAHELEDIKEEYISRDNEVFYHIFHEHFEKLKATAPSRQCEE